MAETEVPTFGIKVSYFWVVFRCGTMWLLFYSFSMIQHNFPTSRKHLQRFVVAGLFFLGACSTQNQSDDESASKTAKESALNLKLAAGKTLYESNCAACHDSGSSGAPKLSNKEAWSGRMAEGKDVMLKKAIEGIDGKVGMMPPRGGNTSLTDEDVKTVILYMTSTINKNEENPSVESPVL